jgi:hypothetical protein
MRLNLVLMAAACSCAALLGSCVERTITITSDPPGALVWLNEREIGRTPLDVEFLYYGEYDVRLEREGYEPLLTTGDAKAPVWDIAPLDLGAELIPAELHSQIEWHYVLQPRNDDSAALIERAAALRRRVADREPAAAEAGTLLEEHHPAVMPQHAEPP